MDYNTMNATVKGTTCEGEPFTESLTFTLVPPTDNKHYGTGYSDGRIPTEPSGGNKLLKLKQQRDGIAIPLLLLYRTGAQRRKEKAHEYSQTRRLQHPIFRTGQTYG